MPIPRQSDHGILPIFTDRWSPRAFDGTTITQAELMPLFEAARWAPSAFNAQPWRFVYALRGTPAFDHFLAALIPFNRGWAASASALIFVFSDCFSRNADGSPKQRSHSHSFDAGAAWAQFALQATSHGLHVHGMSGFDEAAAREAAGAPESFRVEAAVAVGRIGDPATLPESLQTREHPSDRMALSQLVFQGRFPA
jgi:nitroreductase